jgi:hypothetical protein
MTDKCRYAKKKKNILKGYLWCSRYKKTVKNCGYCYGFDYKFPKSLFVWIKELFI